MVRYAKVITVPESWTKNGVTYTIDAKDGVGGVITAQRENSNVSYSRIVSELVTREETEELFGEDLRSTETPTPDQS